MSGLGVPLIRIFAADPRVTRRVVAQCTLLEIAFREAIEWGQLGRQHGLDETICESRRLRREIRAALS